MHITDLNGLRVCILGFGREGQATLRALRKHAPEASITIADREICDPVDDCIVQYGKDYLSGLDKFDWIVKSPGVAPASELIRVHEKLTSATDLFLGTARSAGATVVGITGSKGKSTTSSLIYSILQKDGRAAYLVGNIGQPALDFIEEARGDAVFVIEMSSYQLLSVTSSPHIGVLTSFFPEHLDYHGSLEAYWDAKANIARFQGPKDVLFYHDGFDACRAIAELSPGERIPFAGSDCPVDIAETHLLGEHNAGNIAGAYKVATYLNVLHETAVLAIRSFRGLPHRLQMLGVYHGVRWVDDAISTTPESTIAAMNALGRKVETIILGGQDRGYDFTELAHRVAQSSIRNVILFPGSGARIEEALRLHGKASDQLSLWHAASMREAVSIAKQVTTRGAICLLSTASPSYGLFRNFEEKGDEFARWVRFEEPPRVEC
jgi:UDP-N-acetylmuramoylalanine--D-glutamate ligase